jgi:ribulose-5-phosphate 4-epimerase/fuculose-1-phosphate aldolase
VLAPGSDELFLVNPEGLFWSEVTASSLLLCDLDGNIVQGQGTVELSAFSLHAPIHRYNKAARAVLHTHSPYATALCLIDHGTVEPVFLSGLQFFGKVVYDEDCQGAAFSVSEGEREAAILGDSNVLMMRNHGPIVVGSTVAAALHPTPVAHGTGRDRTRTRRAGAGIRCLRREASDRNQARARSRGACLRELMQPGP